MSKALIDTDVLLKTASYKLLALLLATQPFGSTDFWMIAAARFVVAGKFKKKLKGGQLEQAEADFQEAIALIVAVEPDADELALAAHLEAAAVTVGVDLDVGESQICALMLSREINLMMTGDKRAIGAISNLKEYEACGFTHGKVACLEQLILWMIESVGLDLVQPAVCPLPTVDKSLTTALGCYTGGGSLATCQEGLSSYINSIRKAAPDVLIKYPG